jgi:hypothetical protein
MALSSHDPILPRRLSHASHRMVHFPTRPTPLPVVLYRTYRGNSAWQQQERPIWPFR